MDHTPNTIPEDAWLESDIDQPRGHDGIKAGDARQDARVKTLIRSAKLITAKGEFVCVVRDVSRSGIGIRVFHKLPDESRMAIQMPSGREYEIALVRMSGNHAGFRFIEKVDVEALIGECSDYPKRALRFGICFPVVITTIGESRDGLVTNISQQGAAFECESFFAIDQTLIMTGVEDGKGLKEVKAKIRWRRKNSYGVVFDDTMSMDELARLCVQLQSPALG